MLDILHKEDGKLPICGGALGLLDSHEREQVENSMRKLERHDPDYDSIAREIAEVPGIIILEERDYIDDYRYRCAQYVFENSGFYCERLIFDDTENYLFQYGYERVQEPQDGDVVVYRDARSIKTNHFGIYKSGRFFQNFQAELFFDTIFIWCRIISVTRLFFYVRHKLT